MPQPAPFTNAHAFVKGAGYKAKRSGIGRSVLRESPGSVLGPNGAPVEQNLYRLLASRKVLFGLVPVHNIPPGFQVVRSFILVEKVIGMFPNIDPYDRF